MIFSIFLYWLLAIGYLFFGLLMLFYIKDRIASVWISVLLAIIWPLTFSILVPTRAALYVSSKIKP